MTILASRKLFYTHAFETYLIGGLIVFLIGLLVGWILWRDYRAHAERIEAMNDKLRERQDVLTDNNRQLAGLIEDLPEDPQS